MISESDISYSIVIPVYNSEASLLVLAEQLTQVFDGLGKDYEIILVNDCSPDDSWEVIRSIANKNQRFRGVLLARNIGQAKATLCGIGMARGNVVITMDDDLQHDPHLIPFLLKELDSDNGYDALFAYFPQKKHSHIRNLTSRLISLLNSQAFGFKDVRVSSFRLMRRHIATFVRENRSSVATVGALVLAATNQVKSVPVRHRKRTYGKSNYTLFRQLRLAVKNIIGVSMLPLRLISSLGLFTATFSGFLTVYFLIKYLTSGISVAGWTSIVVLLTFFSGLILLSLGVIGEYLVRVLRELQYPNDTSIRETIGFDK